MSVESKRKKGQTMSETRAVPVELLPCPFCGNENIIIEPDETGSGGQDVPPYKAVCNLWRGGCGISVFGGDFESDAVIAWNKRAASPPQGEPVAWRRWENEMWIYYETNAWPDCIPLYAHPPTAPQAMNPLKMIGGEHPASCVCFICKPPELKAAPQVEGLEQFETIRRLATTLDGTVCYQGDVLRHEAIALYRQYVRECDKAAARIALAENIAHRAEHRANQLESDLAQEQAAREVVEKELRECKEKLNGK